MSLHHKIFIGMGVGVVAGFTLHFALPEDSEALNTVTWWLDLFGKDLFIGALKMIIFPQACRRKQFQPQLALDVVLC